MTTLRRRIVTGLAILTSLLAGCGGGDSQPGSDSGAQHVVVAPSSGSALTVRPAGIAFEVSSPWGSARLKSPLIGRFNAHNLLGTLAVLLASDVPLDASIRWKA